MKTRMRSTRKFVPSRAAKALSGFWIGELAAAIYALEWPPRARRAPSEVMAVRGRGQEKIAAIHEAGRKERKLDSPGGKESSR